MDKPAQIVNVAHPGLTMSANLPTPEPPAPQGLRDLLKHGWRHWQNRKSGKETEANDDLFSAESSAETAAPAKPPLKSVGYWSERLDDDYLIHPARLIDFRWHAAERAKIITYLRNGIVFSSSLGWADCRFPDGPSGPEMGCRDLTDGIWVWPEGLWLYVSRYGVRLPEEFVTDMRTRGFDAFPDEDRWGIAGWEAREKDDRLRTAPSWTALVDAEFWREWTKKERLRAEAEELLG